jgi:hypothetical protein
MEADDLCSAGSACATDCYGLSACRYRQYAALKLQEGIEHGAEGNGEKGFRAESQRGIVGC